jgi:2-polyprenyl-6-methoxyphenol hydroxylase-like FAD-dependent oxidoreductase
VSNRRENEGSHAIVIGASLAGLLAGHVLADHFDRVTFIERDHLPQGPEFRTAVPQARHIHVLLVRGNRLLEQLFPGLDNELAAAGAEIVDWAADTWWFNFGTWKPRFPSELISHLCSRELLEWIIRRRVASSSKIRWLAECDVTALLTDENNTRVIGVRLHARAARGGRLNSQAEPHEEPVELHADLVVNASGRDSRAAEWLAKLGYPSPQETRVNSFLGYASRCYRRPKDRQPEWKALVVSATPPDISRGAVLVPLEGERWLVTLAGAARDYPPTDETGFVDFARSLPTPVLYEAIQDALPVTSIFGYRRTENVRRYYEKLPRYLEGLVTLGDAVCAFNPVYGQGMTVAALGASALDECLREQRRLRPAGELAGLAERFQKKLGRVVATPWLLATGEDFRYPTTEGAQPHLATRILRPYLDQVLLTAAENPRAHQAFLQVVHLVKPPTALFHISVLAPVLAQVVRQKWRWMGGRAVHS